MIFYIYNLVIKSRDLKLDISIRNAKAVSICFTSFSFEESVTWLLTPESFDRQKVNLVQAYLVINTRKTKSFMQFDMT